MKQETSSLRHHYQVGIEVELLMPVGVTRQDVAESVADAVQGRVTMDWHLDSEPAVHKQIAAFQHLTPRFQVRDSNDDIVATFVNDVTIRKDLDPKSPARSDWTRILSDDRRILRMLGEIIPPGEQDADHIESLLSGLGLRCQVVNSAIRVTDASGVSVALIVAAPGERHRVVECISPPLLANTEQWLERVVGTLKG